MAGMGGNLDESAPLPVLLPFRDLWEQGLRRTRRLWGIARQTSAGIEPHRPSRFKFDSAVACVQGRSAASVSQRTCCTIPLSWATVCAAKLSANTALPCRSSANSRHSRLSPRSLWCHCAKSSVMLRRHRRVRSSLCCRCWSSSGQNRDRPELGRCGAKLAVVCQSCPKLGAACPMSNEFDKFRLPVGQFDTD